MLDRDPEGRKRHTNTLCLGTPMLREAAQHTLHTEQCLTSKTHGTLTCSLTLTLTEHFLALTTSILYKTDPIVDSSPPAPPYDSSSPSLLPRFFTPLPIGSVRTVLLRMRLPRILYSRIALATLLVLLLLLRLRLHFRRRDPSCMKWNGMEHAILFAQILFAQHMV
jgi:hypothetical protein